MSGKLNCWEILNCGREPGGANTNEFGVCPAASDESLDGINGGKNGGRVCWAVAGTFCEGEVQGVFACKIDSCMNCSILQMVSKEQGSGFHLMPPESNLLENLSKEDKDSLSEKADQTAE